MQNPEQIESSTTSQVKQLLEALRLVYEKKGKQSDFSDELAVHTALLPKLIESLGSMYEVVKPFGLGSTATIWLIRDLQLQQDRALKLPRPRLGKLRDIVTVVRTEAGRLAQLQHQNIIRIYTAAEIQLSIGADDYAFPYFVMDFLEGVEDLDKFILKHRNSLSGLQIIRLLRDLLQGIAFLHEREIIHCDIKPGNLVIPKPDWALVADLGYAKNLSRPPLNADPMTGVVYTPLYAHPDLRAKVSSAADSNANVAHISRSELRPAFDLYAFGRTMQEVLAALRLAESSDSLTDVEATSKLTAYQWLYLNFIAKRLLDGRVEHKGGDDLVSDIIPGLTPSVMMEIRYETADQALDDFEKLLHLFDLEGELPELNPTLPKYIQIPHCRVPLTRRVDRTISHPTFRRLGQVSQLGFVSLVYPGATHTRLEHVLGTFTHCCEYVRALWYDQANCLFQLIMSPHDLKRGLLAALVHDVAQYPMAHDLTEIDGRFAHERLTRGLLDRLPPGESQSLADIIRMEWQVDAEDILRVLEANRTSSLRDRLLHALVSGPLDCDKFDYIMRDSTHLGITYGMAIDDGRLLRNLTTVYDTNTKGDTLIVAELGVTEKALIVAQAITDARRQMFTQVYWQHTVRSLKSMLGYALRRILVHLSEEGDSARFWTQLHGFVLTLQATSCGDQGEAKAAKVDDDDCFESMNPNDVHFTELTTLGSTDDNLLSFLWSYSDEPGRQMIRMIRARALYRRLAVLSGNREKATYQRIYDFFRALRTVEPISGAEAWRRRCERAMIDKAAEGIAQQRSQLQTRGDLVEALAAMGDTEPLMLVDVPVKAMAPDEDRSATLRYLPEDYLGAHVREQGAAPRFSESPDLDQATFDKQVGKIRVFVHPRWRDLLVQVLSEDEIFSIISAQCEHQS